MGIPWRVGVELVRAAVGNASAPWSPEPPGEGERRRAVPLWFGRPDPCISHLPLGVVRAVASAARGRPGRPGGNPVRPRCAGELLRDRPLGRPKVGVVVAAGGPLAAFVIGVVVCSGAGAVPWCPGGAAALASAVALTPSAASSSPWRAGPPARASPACLLCVRVRGAIVVSPGGVAVVGPAGAREAPASVCAVVPTGAARAAVSPIPVVAASAAVAASSSSGGCAPCPQWVLGSGRAAPSISPVRVWGGR